MEGGDSEFTKFTVPTLKAFFLKAHSQSVPVVHAIGCPEHTFSTLAIFWLTDKWCRHFFSILHHLSPVILSNATALPFVLLHNSRFNFHCYPQHEATPTLNVAWKWQLPPFVTSCIKDYEEHSFLQTSFTELPNRRLEALMGQPANCPASKLATTQTHTCIGQLLQ